MTIKTIKDLPECVKKIVELYYTTDSSTAFAQSEKSRNRYPEHALLIDTAVELFHQAPESMYAFYDLLLDRLASKPVRMTSEEAHFDAREDVSETSQSPLFDDIFAAALNASFNETPYLRPPADPAPPAPAAAQPPIEPIKESKPKPNGNRLKPVNYAPVQSRPQTISTPKPQLEDDSFDPFQQFADDPIAPVPTSARTPSSTRDPLNLGIESKNDIFDLNIELDESFSEFERDNDVDIDDFRSLKRQDNLSFGSPSARNPLSKGANLPMEETAPPISLFQAFSASPAPNLRSSKSSPSNIRPSSTPTTVVSGSDILNLINSTHASYSRSAADRSEPRHAFSSAASQSLKSNTPQLKPSGFSMSSQPHVPRSTADISQNEVTSTPRSFISSKSENAAKSAKKSVFGNTNDPLHLNFHSDLNATSGPALSDTHNPHLNETSAPCLTNNQDILRLDPNMTRSRNQAKNANGSAQPIAPSEAHEDILQSLATFMDPLPDDEDSGFNHDLFVANAMRAQSGTSLTDKYQDINKPPSYRRATHDYIDSTNKTAVASSTKGEPSLSFDSLNLLNDGNNDFSPIGKSTAARDMGKRAQTLDPTTRSDPSYRRVGTDQLKSSPSNDRIAKDNPIGTPNKRIVSSDNRVISSDNRALAENLFEHADPQSLGTRRSGSHASYDNKTQSQTRNYIAAVGVKNRSTAVGVHPVTQTYLTPASDTTHRKVDAKISMHKETFETDALMALHPLSRMPSLCISLAELSRRTDIDSKAGFILSLIDGTVSLADILSLSAWSQTETAAIICKLENNHIIRLE